MTERNAELGRAHMARTGNTAREILYSSLVNCLLPSARRILMLLTTACCISSAKAQVATAYDAALARCIANSPLLLYRERQLSLHSTLPGWALGAVSGVAVGHNGDLYVIQRGPDAEPILVFDLNGNLVRSWGRGDFSLPHSLRLDREGNVWAIDAGAPKLSSIPLPVPSSLRSASRLCRTRAARFAALPTLRFLQTVTFSLQMDTGTVVFWNTRRKARKYESGGTPVLDRVSFICRTQSRLALQERYTLRTGRTGAFSGSA